MAIFFNNRFCGEALRHIALANVDKKYTAIFRVKF